MNKYFSNISFLIIPLLLLLLASCQPYKGEEIESLSYGLDNGHKYVDLGLSVKWATCNVGASSPEEFGDYFAWGETAPKEKYDIINYKYRDSKNKEWTKYFNLETDLSTNNVMKNQLEMMDDAAHVNWKGRWRMPTSEEFQELIDSCVWTWGDYNGVVGYDVKGVNGNRIFLPVTGYYSGDYLHFKRKPIDLYYLSNTKSSSPYMSQVNCLSILDPFNFICMTTEFPEHGYVVRPVQHYTAIPKYYIISFYSNGGNGFMNQQQCNENEMLILMGNVFQYDSYSFLGWDVNPDGNEISYIDKQSILVDKDLSLYAQWGYYVTFDGNGGLGKMEDQPCKKEKSITLASNKYVREGYYFDGWNTKPDGSGVFFENMQCVNLESNIQLYAQWIPLRGQECGYEWIDLGLSVKWATCNLGASSPEEFGDYFAWGEVEEKEFYNWSTYRYGNVTNGLTKYCTNKSYGNNAYVDDKVNLDRNDDVAYMNWSGNWRLPTENEIHELINDCVWHWGKNKDVNGYYVTSKINNNEIFIPASGCYIDFEIQYLNNYGYYMSNSIFELLPSRSIVLKYDSTGVNGSSLISRYVGLTVRAVCP